LTAIYVPCGEMERFKQMLNNDSRINDHAPLPYTITINAEHGNVTYPQTMCDDMSLNATPDYGYHFVQWSDGVTDNPRTIELTRDTTFTAEFAIDKTGNCGDDNALIWTYDAETKTLTITGNGTLNSNYTFGVEAPTQMQKLVIGNEVTSIGDSAFYGMSTINHLIIGGSVATIGNYAFAECRNFDDITCYATTVPIINETTFTNVGNKQYIYLFVPEARERAYHRDTYWGEFDIQVQQAEGTIVTTNDVQVEPQDNAAIVTWPTNDNAATYTIQITKDGVVFCTLIFNGNGQLTGIAFAPSRDGSHHAPAAVMTAKGMQFTVTGLDSGTHYALTLQAKDSQETVLASYSSEFTTTGHNAPQGFDEISSSLQGGDRGRLILHDGQIYILRGEKVYTLTGAEVK
jgi:hemin uptake protein HemP